MTEHKMPLREIVITLVVPEEHAARVKSRVIYALKDRWGDRPAPWLPGSAFANVAEVTVNGVTVVNMSKEEA